MHFHTGIFVFLFKDYGGEKPAELQEGISGRVGIDGSVGITSSWVTPAGQEHNWYLLLKTAGCTTFSLTKRAFDGCLAFREKLSSRAEGFSMAGNHVDMKPWRIILKLCLGFLTSRQMPFALSFHEQMPCGFLNQYLTRSFNT